MLVRKIAPLTTALVAVFILSVVGASASPDVKTSAAVGRQLNGTWMTTVSLDDPPPGVDPTFLAVDTFLADGNMLVSSAQPNPALRSLAHGEWTRTDDGQFAWSFVWFRFDATGKFVGTQRVHRTMTLASTLDSFQSSDVVEVVAPDGAIVATLQATEVGNRLGV